MNNAVNSKNISTAKQITLLALPASLQRKALETLVQVETLIAPFFATRERKGNAKAILTTKTA